MSGPQQMQSSSVSLREERSARPRPASEASPTQFHPPAPALLPLASGSLSQRRSRPVRAGGRRRTGWLPRHQRVPKCEQTQPLSLPER